MGAKFLVGLPPRDEDPFLSKQIVQFFKCPLFLEVVDLREDQIPDLYSNQPQVEMEDAYRPPVWINIEEDSKAILFAVMGLEPV